MLYCIACFNPFETGLGLSTPISVGLGVATGFNPFETGLGLSTERFDLPYEEVLFQSL